MRNIAIYNVTFFQMSAAIRSALHAAGYKSIRQLALELLEDHPAVFTRPATDDRPLSKTPSSALEILLGRLDKGKDLVWWRKRPDAAALVAKKLGIEIEAFRLDQRPSTTLFAFESFPALPALELTVEERYDIARPVLVASEKRQTQTWNNLQDWLSGGAISRDRKQLEWLEVPDEAEFNLIKAHLLASSRHRTIPVAIPAQAGGKDIEALRLHSPLVLTVQEKVGPSTLALLRERAQNAPLLVISLHRLPDLQEKGDSNDPAIQSVLPPPIAWRWTFHADWRQMLLRWVVKRLTDYKIPSGLNPIYLGKWLHDVDPGEAWFSSPTDVLGLCRIAHDESVEALQNIKNHQTGHDLLGRVFGLKPRQLKRLEKAVRLRWCDWQHAWDSDVDRAGWLEAGLSESQFNGLLEDELLEGTLRYRFANRILVRLLLRRVLDQYVRTVRPTQWWPACFDGARRALLDATLASMPMRNLATAAEMQKKLGVDSQYLAGPAEALFVAIGKQLARGEALSDAMHMVGQIIFERFQPNGRAAPPWSRPCNTWETDIEWTSSLWAWSLSTPPQQGVAPSWLMPGWNDSLPDKYPDWLDPRLNPYQEWMPDRAALAYFLAVSHRYVKQTGLALSGTVPLLLKPAMLCEAAAGSRTVDPSWWGGIIGQNWAESALLDMLTKMATEQWTEAARRLWPSLVQWQRLALLGRGAIFTRKHDLLLPSCREGSQGFSPVLEWVARNLHDTNLLDGLGEEEKLFIEEHPQWLLTEHKLQVLRARAARLPLPLAPFESYNYFSAFLPDAATGLCWFLHDEVLGAEASAGLWNWAPEQALALLSSECNNELKACRQLFLCCPTAYLGAALAVLRRMPSLLPDEQRKAWIQRHLPSSGQHARELFALINS